MAKKAAAIIHAKKSSSPTTVDAAATADGLIR